MAPQRPLRPPAFFQCILTPRNCFQPGPGSHLPASIPFLEAPDIDLLI